MKKIISLCFCLIALLFAANSAMADDLTGRLGVTGRIGFLVPADSDLAGRNADTDTGFVGGGGFIYGITRNIAVEFDITHTEFDANGGANNSGSAETNNFSLGAQYRFDSPVAKLIPFVGGGLDILVNDFSLYNGNKASVDTTLGVHLSAGADYFLMRQLALTAQLKGILAPDADITYQGTKIGNFDPMSISMTFGARYFFN